MNNKLVCKCGSTWFTLQSQVIYQLDDRGEKRYNTAHAPFECIRFKCDKCGTLYNRYEEELKEGE